MVAVSDIPQTNHVDSDFVPRDQMDVLRRKFTIAGTRRLFALVRFTGESVLLSESAQARMIQVLSDCTIQACSTRVVEHLMIPINDRRKERIRDANSLFVAFMKGD